MKELYISIFEELCEQYVAQGMSAQAAEDLAAEQAYVQLGERIAEQQDYLRERMQEDRLLGLAN
jgi:hypothetical protein